MRPGRQITTWGKARPIRHVGAEEVQQIDVLSDHHAGGAHSVRLDGRTGVREPLDPLPLRETIRRAQHRDTQVRGADEGRQVRHDQPRDADRVLAAARQLDMRIILQGNTEGDAVQVAVSLNKARHRRQAHNVRVRHGRQVGSQQLHRQALLRHANSRIEHFDARLTLPHALTLFRHRNQGLGRGKSPVHESPLAVSDVTDRLPRFRQVRQVLTAQRPNLLTMLGDLPIDVERDHGDHGEHHAARHHQHHRVATLTCAPAGLGDRHEHHDAHRAHHRDHHRKHVADARGLSLVRRSLDGNLPFGHLRYALQAILRVSHRSSLVTAPG